VGSAIVRDLVEGRVVLVDVSGLGSTEEVLVASFLARRVMEEWSTAYLDEPERHERMPVVAIVLEEAQRVLSSSRDRESNVFPRVAREGRKFKVGLCAITQQPKLLDDELLSQFNTFFILGLADEKDRNILRGSSKQDISALGPEIQTLMPGECLIANLAAPFAVPARVHFWDDVVRSVPPPPAPRAVAAPNVGALVAGGARGAARRRRRERQRAAARRAARPRARTAPRRRARPLTWPGSQRSVTPTSDGRT
jgi:hypothetical protein